MKLKDYFNHTSYADILRLTKYELAFCIGYFVFALIICFNTTRGGAIFSPDSITYVSIAENFAHMFPHYSEGPVYPLLIAIGMAFGLSSEQSASIIPMISYSLLGLPFFLLSKVISRPIAGYIACIIMLLCTNGLLYISIYAWTDMPYLLISMMSILFLSIYNKYKIQSSIVFAAIFALVAEFTRVIGITLFIAGMIVLIVNNDKYSFKKSIISIANYCFLSGAPFLVFVLITGMNRKWISLNSPQNPSIDIIILTLWKVIDQMFFRDYKIIFVLILIGSLAIMVHLAIKGQLIIFIKDSLPLSSYIIIYLIVLTIVTSSIWISVAGGLLDDRKVIQIYPYAILFIASLYSFYYNGIDIKNYRHIIKIICIVVLIYSCFFGSNALYSYEIYMGNFIAMYHSDRCLFDNYISENNITNQDKLYLNANDYYPLKFSMTLHMNGLYKLKNKYIANNYGKSIFDNLTSCTDSSAKTLFELAKENHNVSTYIIVPNNIAQIYLRNSYYDICLSNSCRFSDAIIFEISLPEGHEPCYSCQAFGSYVLKNYSLNEIMLSGNFNDTDYMGRNYDQLLVFNSSLKKFRKFTNTCQFVDFINKSSISFDYHELNGTMPKVFNPLKIVLAGNFISHEYDQVLSIDYNPNESEIIIEDLNQGKSPPIIRYSEAFSNSSLLNNLTDPEDTQLVGDFLALGHSQALFMDRSSNEKRLVLADFTKNKSAQFTEIPLTGESSRISRWLDKDDLQFAGDFMGLGHSQVLFINRNHTKDEKEKLIIVDFSNEDCSPLIKYQENWKESSLLSGWLDANDTQLAGDFMNLGYSQVLFVNHAKKGGKIAIVDFSKSGGKPPALTKFIDNWNRSDLFEGWLDLNDTKIAGDFKGLGYDQVLFLNSSSNGTNATIVEFASGKPLIAI